MSKTIKILLISLVAVIVVVGTVLTLAVANLDRIIKVAVEKIGTQTLGTEVTLASVEISLKSAAGGLNGLVIANPEGFTTENAFELDRVSLDLDLSTIRSDVIVVNLVVVDGARVVFEEKAGKTNLQELLKNIEKAPESGEAPSSDDEAGSEGPKLVIKEFRFTNAETRLITEQLGQDMNAKIPNVVLNDIGTKGGGVTATEAARQLLDPLIQQVLKGAQQQVMEQAKQKVTKGLMDKLGL